MFAAIVATGFVLGGCSPDDSSGVKLSARGTPVLVNCGTYFTRLDAFDADTGRLVWSAGSPQGTSEYGVGEIEVGVLPDIDWLEYSPSAGESRPAVWRFVVDRTGYDEPVTFTAARSALSNDHVFIFDSGKNVPADEFIGKTCGYDPPIPPAITRVFVWTALAATAIVAAVVGTIYVRRRRRSLP